jgi:hypothetical protein
MSGLQAFDYRCEKRLQNRKTTVEGEQKGLVNRQQI